MLLSVMAAQLELGQVLDPSLAMREGEFFDICCGGTSCITDDGSPNYPTYTQQTAVLTASSVGSMRAAGETMTNGDPIAITQFTTGDDQRADALSTGPTTTANDGCWVDPGVRKSIEHLDTVERKRPPRRGSSQKGVASRSRVVEQQEAGSRAAYFESRCLAVSGGLRSAPPRARAPRFRPAR
ncbi:MAG: hypothetical protein HOW73_18760 [Polyangiaceae bacterium]|nr:hypothetical protein [Polyangiaceae bacterium]